MASKYKKIKGGLITITDETIKFDSTLEVEVTQDQINNASNQNIYLELDLTVAKAVEIILPEISTLKGQLGFCIWVNDKGGTTGSQQLQLSCSGDDTTAGQTSVALNAKGSGILISPVGNTSWGTFYTQNTVKKLAEVDADEDLVLFKPKA